MYITVIFENLVLKLYKNEIYDESFKATADPADKDSYNCSTPELWKNFCDGLERKLTSPLGGI